MQNTEVLIYSKDNCPWCVKANTLCSNLKLTTKVIDLTSDKEEQQKFRKRLPDAKTLPQIFWGDMHIGGYTEFEAFMMERVYGEE